MDNRTKEDIIIVDLESKESLCEALKLFKDKLVNDKLVLGGDDEYLTCFAKSTDGKAEAFTKADITDEIFATNVLAISGCDDTDSASEYYVESFSNTVFLTAALQHEDLKHDLLALIKAIVVLVNKKEKTYNLWVDEEHTFGVEFIVAFVLKYPDYTYLISDFVLANWDDEHAGYVLNILYDLKCRRGYDRHLIKAIAYAKCQELFLTALGINYYDGDDYSEDAELFHHFKKTPQDYIYFKDQYIEFAKQSQRAAKFANGLTYAEYILRRIAPELTDEEWETEIFIDDTFKNEAAKFSAELEVNFNEIKKTATYKNRVKKESWSIYDDEEDEYYENED
ncbi:MAG: hypothetical protein WBG43_05635 [Marinifilaceae bacterium]